MRATKKALPAAVLTIFVLAALMPAAALAAPTEWDAVLEAYPDHAIEDFVMELDATRKSTWEDIVGVLGAENQVTVRVYGRDGNRINVLTDRIPIATGEHVSVTLVEDTRGVRLFQVIIRGDVLGTGQLTIAQLARLAAALNGSRPLEGLYAQAGDINGSGHIDIADLTQLASWLRSAG